MNTKNFTLLFSFLILSISLNAQNQKPSFGITAGATFASYKATVDNVSLTAKTRVGFTAGFVSSFSMGKSFSFQPGLNFTQKGGTLKDDGSNTTNEATYNYLEMPLNFVYNTHSSKGAFFIGAGPSFSIGLSGTYKITGMYEESGDIKFGSGDDDDLKSFEAGINLLTGYQFKGGFLISANYNFGLSDISNDDQVKFHNNYFGLRLGYMLPNKKK